MILFWLFIGFLVVSGIIVAIAAAYGHHEANRPLKENERSVEIHIPTIPANSQAEIWVEYNPTTNEMVDSGYTIVPLVEEQ